MEEPSLPKRPLMKTRSLLVLGFLLAVGTAHAQSAQEEVLPMPPYRDFMEACLEGAVETQESLGKTPEEYRKDVFAGGLVCQCVYDGLASSPTLTPAGFEARSGQCLVELQGDAEGFIRKYVERSQAMYQATQPGN